MHPLLRKLEVLVDTSIPLLVAILLVVIIAELGFPHQAEPYEYQIELLDQFIIAVFVVDLAFKFNRVRKIKKFIKLYWLDILVVFPFFLFFRLIEKFLVLLIPARTVAETQRIAHTGIELEKEAAEIFRKTEKISRGRAILFVSEKFPRVRALFRIPRLLKVFGLFEKGPKSSKSRKKKKNT